MSPTAETIYGYIPFDIPEQVLEAFFPYGRGLGDERELNSKLGRLWLFLAMQPTISQGGIYIARTESQRKLFLSQARACFLKADDKEGLSLLPDSMRVHYGYKGSVL